MPSIDEILIFCYFAKKHFGKYLFIPEHPSKDFDHCAGPLNNILLASLIFSKKRQLFERFSTLHPLNICLLIYVVCEAEITPKKFYALECGAERTPQKTQSRPND